MAKKELQEKTLIVDIGTAFVTAGMVSVGKDHIAHLGASERVPLSTGTETSKESLPTILAPALKTLAEKFLKETPRRVRVVLSAPWHEASIRTLHSTAPKPVPISSRTVARTVQEVKNQKPPSPNSVDVEATTVQVIVNGYPTGLSHAVTGQHLALNVYESEASAQTLNDIENELHRQFPHATVTFHTFPLAAMVALRALTDETSFMVVDCAGEMTEVTVVHRDSIEHLSTFPIGYYAIARAFGGEGASIADSLTRLALFARGELHDTDAEQATKQYAAAIAEWKKGLEEVCAHASEAVPLPRTLFLISDTEPLVWLKVMFAEGAIRGIHVEPVTPSMVQPLVTLDDNASFDTFLSLAGIFFHIYERELVGE